MIALTKKHARIVIGIAVTLVALLAPLAIFGGGLQSQDFSAHSATTKATIDQVYINGFGGDPMADYHYTVSGGRYQGSSTSDTSDLLSFKQGDTVTVHYSTMKPSLSCICEDSVISWPNGSSQESFNLWGALFALPLVLYLAYLLNRRRKLKSKNTKEKTMTVATHSSWPGAFNSIASGFRAISQNPRFAALYIAIGGIGDFLIYQHPNSSAGDLVSLLGSLALVVAFTRYGLLTAQNKPGSIPELLRTNVTEYVSVVAAFVVFCLLLVISAVGLFIPLIWIIPWTSFILFAVVDRHVGVVESFKISKQLGQHLKGKIWGLMGVSIVCFIAAAVLGLVPVIGWIVQALASGALSLATCTAVAKLYYYAEKEAKS